MVFIALLLSTIGIIEIWTINQSLFYKQLVFLIFALIIGYIVYRIFKFAYIQTLFYPFLIFTIFLLILAHLFGSGINRWIDLKLFYLQPSELTKIVLPFLFYIYNPPENFGLVSSIILILLFLIITQPDLGFAIAIAFVSFWVFYYSNVNRNFLLFILFSIIAIFVSFNAILFLITFIGLIIILFYILRAKWYWSLSTLISFLFIGVITPIIWFNVLKPYQRARIIAFLNPEEYKKNEAYQTYQSQIAIGSGGLFGIGYNEGTQKKYGFLPEAHTDFIFASICEDFGFFGGFLVITLILILILRMIFIFTKIEDPQIKRFALPIMLFFIYSFIINISVNLGIIPAKGYPLLFVSYGGSHLVVDYICLFLMLKINKIIEEF